MLAAGYNMETSSLPTHPVPAPEKNVVVQVENNEAAVEESRKLFYSQLQTAYLATQEITATDKDVHGSVAGETESCVSTADSAPSFFYHRFLERITITNPKRPK
jgi:hypothetical protein